jgi:uncharacterized Zn-binding protein involved in type VI secretion
MFCNSLKGKKMPKVARQYDDTTTGHSCDSVTEITGPHGEPSKVYANNIPVECLGNPTVPHQEPAGDGCSTHIEYIHEASTSVFIGGIAVARIGDKTDYGGEIITGSPNVYAGG